MDAGWIQVFVLMLNQCVAPEGKTVCQENVVRMDFLNKAECELALEQIAEYADSASNVLVNRDDSACLPTARKLTVYETAELAQAALSGQEGWGEIPMESESVDFTQKAHKERLANVPECGKNGGVTPCKIGEIILEGATEKRTEVWQRAN